MAEAVIAAAALAYGVYSGERANSQGISARKLQRSTQQSALQDSLATQRRADMATAQVNRQQPDPMSLLAGEMDAQNAKGAAIDRTKRRDLANMNVKLGRPTLLGG
jgi:hypothetical protein